MTTTKTHSQRMLYMRALLQSLAAQDQDSTLSLADYEVVLAAERQRMGPYDCAAQIIANRQDAITGEG